MNNQFTKNQINMLGERLRQGALTAPDLKMLELFRRSFGPAYETTIRILRDELGLEPTGRPGKSTSSIIEKLQRERSRLVTIQDIAGCRVVVDDCIKQNELLPALSEYFPVAKIYDRREKPSYGYRAVHIVAIAEEKPIEIQVRTTLQHLWAEISERLADRERAIKYGGGSPELREALDSLSTRVAEYENLEIRLAALATPSNENLMPDLPGLKLEVETYKANLETDLKTIMSDIEEILKGTNRDDLST